MEDGFFAKSSGRIFIFEQDASVNGIFIEFSFRNLQLLRRGGGADAYALYATTPTFGRLRLITFNGQTFTGSIPAPLPDQDQPNLREIWRQAWMEDDITLRVFAENDDGHDAQDPGGFLILEGTDFAF
jgi:hypothetical protein